MRLIDERYLTVHPRTALWWQQREQCAECARVMHRPTKSRDNSGSGGGMVCRAEGRRDDSCISAREPGMPCGPDAKLFVPRETA